jgi:hypothetical protein
MKNIALNLKQYLKNKKFMTSVAVGLIFLCIGLVINFYAAEYAAQSAGNSVSDLILDHIPVVDVDGIAVYGPLVLWLFVAVLCIEDPKIIPFVLKCIAIFVIIRAGFVTLTHLGPIPDSIDNSTAPAFLKAFTFGNDLFFSGHTGLPFLMALTFWNRRVLRYIFICTAVLFGTIMLLAHLHYSIDVVSAFFITYTIFHIAKDVLFKKDFRVFNEGLTAIG